MALVSTTNENKQQKEPSMKIKKRRTINSSFSKKTHLSVSSLSLSQTHVEGENNI